MRIINFPLISIIIIQTLVGCVKESDSNKMKELEDFVSKKEILEGGVNFSDELKEFEYALNLYESIEDKSIISNVIIRDIGIFYLYSGNIVQATSIINMYLEKSPNDAEAIFYRGVISKLNNEEYCQDIKMAKELGFEPNVIIKFTWDLHNECI